MKFMNIMTILLILLFAGSCAEEETHEESQDSHVCEHLIYGPAAELQTFATAEEALQALQADETARVQYHLHTRYDLQLLCSGSGCEGYVAYLPEGDEGILQDYVFYASSDPVLTVYPAEDLQTPVPAEYMEDHSEDCDLIRMRSVYPLNSSSIYILHITSEDSMVSAVFPALLEDEHDH